MCLHYYIEEVRFEVDSCLKIGVLENIVLLRQNSFISERDAQRQEC